MADGGKLVKEEKLATEKDDTLTDLDAEEREALDGQSVRTPEKDPGAEQAEELCEEMPQHSPRFAGR